MLARAALAALLLFSTSCSNSSGPRPADSPSTPSPKRDETPKDARLDIADRYVKLARELSDVYRRLKTEYDGIDEKDPARKTRLKEIGRGDLSRQRDELRKQIDQVMAQLKERKWLWGPFLSREDVQSAMDELDKADAACDEAWMRAFKLGPKRRPGDR